MRFRRHQGNLLPELNLVPMMDVLMTVLTFFIIISMLLSEERGVSVVLPPGADTPQPAELEELPEPLLVTLNAQGQLLIEGEAVLNNQWQGPMQVYLKSNPKGFVVLQADRQLPYDQVIQVLADMKKVGGDRISLAIDAPMP